MVRVPTGKPYVELCDSCWDILSWDSKTPLGVGVGLLTAGGAQRLDGRIRVRRLGEIPLTSL
jgi:hypothetical protein